MSIIKKYIWLIIISMLPIVEIRGAIPVAVGFKIPITEAYILCLIANMIPVPFIYIFSRKLLEWGINKKYIKKPFLAILNKGKKAGEKLSSSSGRYGVFVALALFVGIPIPGTGAWTGTLAASILELDFKKSIAAVFIGVLIAGAIIFLGSIGVFGIIGKLFNI